MKSLEDRPKYAIEGVWVTFPKECRGIRDRKKMKHFINFKTTRLGDNKSPGRLLEALQVTEHCLKQDK